MQLKWGSYAFAADSLTVATAEEIIRTDAGYPYACRMTATVSGYLLANGQEALSIAAIALKQALRTPYQDLVLLRDDGQESAMVMKNADSMSGVVVTRGPDFPEGRGAEWVNRRAFTFTVESEILLTTDNGMITFTESLSFFGGGPEIGASPYVEGPPVEFVLYQQTPYQATQDGQMVTLRDWPIVPPPKWPANEIGTRRRIEPVTPRRRGNGYTEFTVRYHYEFISAFPLVGTPTLWP